MFGGLTKLDLNSILQEFYYLNYASVVNPINTYATSFLGFCLWDLYLKECDRLYRSWNVAMRQVHNVPNTTHKRQHLIHAMLASVSLY